MPVACEGDTAAPGSGVAVRQIGQQLATLAKALRWGVIVSHPRSEARQSGVSSVADNIGGRLRTNRSRSRRFGDLRDMTLAVAVSQKAAPNRYAPSLIQSLAPKRANHSHCVRTQIVLQPGAMLVRVPLAVVLQGKTNGMQDDCNRDNMTSSASAGGLGRRYRGPVTTRSQLRATAVAWLCAVTVEKL